MTNHFPYTIQAGDSLSKIANRLNACAGVNATAIQQANPNISATELPIGQVVIIPAAHGNDLHYTVVAGDNWSRIAKNINAAAGITYQQIGQANPTINPDQIFVGQVIQIPMLGQQATTGSSTTTPQGPTNDTAKNIGYWHWTYHHSTAPAGTTMGIAFFGSTDPDTALQQSAKVKDLLQGERYICLGGGTSTGSYHSSTIDTIVSAIKAGDFADYQGLAFDVEVGAIELENDFKNLFAVTKAHGFKILVTISHSRPYGIKDGTSLMDTFLADDNIDFLSPQLYTTGKESANDYTAYGIHWSDYAQAKAAVIPSIAKAAYYPDAVQHFSAQGVRLAGYIQWQQH